MLTVSCLCSHLCSLVAVILKSLTSLFYRYHLTIPLSLHPTQNKPQSLFCFFLILLQLISHSTKSTLCVCVYIFVCVWRTALGKAIGPHYECHRSAHMVPSPWQPPGFPSLSLSVLLSVSHSHKHTSFSSPSLLF